MLILYYNSNRFRGKGLFIFRAKNFAQEGFKTSSLHPSNRKNKQNKNQNKQTSKQAWYHCLISLSHVIVWSKVTASLYFTRFSENLVHFTIQLFSQHSKANYVKFMVGLKQGLDLSEIPSFSIKKYFRWRQGWLFYSFVHVSFVWWSILTVSFE